MSVASPLPNSAPVWVRSSRTSGSPARTCWPVPDQDRLDDAALEVGDDLELRARDHPALPRTVRSSSVSAAQMKKIDDEADDHPEQDVRRGARLDPVGQVLDVGAVHSMVRLGRLRPHDLLEHLVARTVGDHLALARSG